MTPVSKRSISQQADVIYAEWDGVANEQSVEDALRGMAIAIAVWQEKAERLDTALTRAMDRGNELEAERDSLAARLRAQGYNVTEILMHDLGSAPDSESPTPLVDPPRPTPETWTCAYCGSEDGPHFDRSICACGAMHYYCGHCGSQDDPCDDSSLDSEQE